MSKHEKYAFDSIAIHDRDKGYTTTPHQLPIYATSSFEFQSINQGIDIFTGKEDGHVYARYGNPTVEAVAKKIALLEGYGLDIAPWGIMTSSGMSAISTLLAAEFSRGDKIVTQANLYGGTTELLQKCFSRWGVEAIFTDLKDLDQLEQLVSKDETIRGIYFETPANPTLACINMEGIVAIAKKHSRITAIDNTFMTPYLQQPFAFGVDYVIHSTTKFLNGHGNSISGIIVGQKQEHYKKVWTAMKLLGTNCNPFDAFLLNNGIKTLSLRMDRHTSNAKILAEFLEEHPKVALVNYTGLASHPDHLLAQKQMRDFGAMLSFELKGGVKEGIQFMNALNFCTLAPTLGDVDTLILHPATSSHLNVAKELREQQGISDGLIRVSVGIESIDDIRNDIDQALSTV